MAKPVTITLTAVEAEWLYELLADVFDSGASGEYEEHMAGKIADLLDSATVTNEVTNNHGQ